METCSDSSCSDMSEDALRAARSIPLPPPPLQLSSLQDSESTTVRSVGVLSSTRRTLPPSINLPPPPLPPEQIISLPGCLTHTSPVKARNELPPTEKQRTPLTVEMLRTHCPPETESAVGRIPIADDIIEGATAVAAAAAVVNTRTLRTNPTIAKTTVMTGALGNTLNVTEIEDMPNFQRISGSDESSDALLVSRFCSSSPPIRAVEVVKPGRESFHTQRFTNCMQPQMAGISSQLMPHRSGRPLSRDAVTEQNKDDSIHLGQYSPRTLFEPIDTAINTALLSVTVLGMSHLHTDPLVVHPFVRVWLLNGTTGEPLVVPVVSRASFAHTHPVDLRLRRTRAPWWGAELCLRVLPCAMSAESNAVLLLEVLDTSDECFQGFRWRHKGLYPVCWGFLKIRDVYGRFNLREQMHVEMFPFPQRVSLFTRALQQFLPFSLSSKAVWAEAETPKPLTYSRASPEREANTFVSAVSIPRSSSLAGAAAGSGTDTSLHPPDLFYIYRDARNRKVPYGAGMTVTLKSVEDNFYLPRETIILPYEEYLLNKITLANGESSCRSSFAVSAVLPIKRRTRDTSLSLVSADALGKSYLRKPDERVVPPTQILQLVQIKGRVTCVALSHDGTLLAMGITTDFQHVVQLHNTLERGMRPLSVYHGHVGHIHHAAFRGDAQLLISCSSDKTVRVWRIDRPILGSNATSDMQLCCLCTLTHDFPVYCAIFYQHHIITCGFNSRLLVWRYEKEFLDQLMEFDPIFPDAYNHKTRGLISLDSTTPVEVHIPDKSTDPFLGELVYATEENDESAIYAVCATQLNRLWSVDAAGSVVVWRASYERLEDGKCVFQMSVRRRFKCPGATHVEICGSRAFVTCAKAAVIYLFDVTTYQLVQEVPLHQRPYLPAVTLLPDGEAFVAATSDGKILCWECNTGDLCTSREGYAKAQVHFSVARIAWAKGQQMGVLVGSCGRAERTPLAIIGTPRTEMSVIQQSNPQAQHMFRAQFGDERTAARRSSCCGSKNSRERLVKVKTNTNEESLRAALGPREGPLPDKMTRIGQIVSFWKGLVGQHRHVKDSAEDELVDVRDPAAPYTVVK